MSSSPSTSVQGQSVTLTAMVDWPGGPPMTGSVTFMEGSTQLGTPPFITQGPGGQANLNTTFLTGGSNTITTLYTGDGNYNSVSSTATQAVNPGQPLHQG